MWCTVSTLSDSSYLKNIYDGYTIRTKGHVDKLVNDKKKKM